MARRKEYLTFKEVAERLKRTVRWVRSRVGEGALKAHHFSPRVRMVSEEDFQDYLKSCEPIGDKN